MTPDGRCQYSAQHEKDQALAALAGCAATTPQPATLMDGRDGLKTECHGTAREWSDCLDAARAACPGGFVVDRRDGGSAGVVPFGKDGKFGYGSIIRRTLVFACK